MQLIPDNEHDTPLCPDCRRAPDEPLTTMKHGGQWRIFCERCLRWFIRPDEEGERARDFFGLLDDLQRDGTLMRLDVSIFEDVAGLAEAVPQEISGRVLAFRRELRWLVTNHCWRCGSFFDDLRDDNGRRDLVCE